MATVETEFFPDAVCIVAISDGQRTTLTLRPEDAGKLMQKLEAGFGIGNYQNIEPIPNVESAPALSFWRRLRGIF